MSNKYADKIRILTISLQMKKERYEETINRAARIDQEIRKIKDRIKTLSLLSKGRDWKDMRRMPL